MQFYDCDAVKGQAEGENLSGVPLPALSIGKSFL